jgi:hypothetical protein
MRMTKRLALLVVVIILALPAIDIAAAWIEMVIETLCDEGETNL